MNVCGIHRAQVIITPELSRIKPPSQAFPLEHALADTSGMDLGLEEAGLPSHLPGAHHVALNEPAGETRYPRQWLTLHERVQEELIIKELVDAKKKAPMDSKDCPRPEWKRHGNRHGSFAQCVLCHLRIKWSPARSRWEPKPSRSSSLPEPSSSS